ncbi:unnamed protein product [Orchesella dallaii]|uniref:Uncharacterized protein n=1 Tax=Orchesella dallaii TaxID=48710 RepID=A0ABP1S2K3_9HEXA
MYIVVWLCTEEKGFGLGREPQRTERTKPSELFLVPCALISHHPFSVIPHEFLAPGTICQTVSAEQQSLHLAHTFLHHFQLHYVTSLHNVFLDLI